MNGTDLLETQVDGGGEETVRTAAVVGRDADAVDPRFIHRRQVQLWCHGTVGHDLVLLLVGEHIVDVQTVGAVDRANHHVATDSAGVAHVAVVVTVIELAAGREEE